jgi:hypothetical protein
MSENKMSSRTCGHNRDGVTREWRELHNLVLHNLYSLQNVIEAMKLKRMRSVGHAAYMGDIFVRNSEGR